MINAYIKVERKAKIRCRYNQVPYLTWNTIWESDKAQENTTQESQEVSPFQEGDHKAAGTDKTELQRQTWNINNIKGPQKKHRFGMVSKEITGGLKHV